MQERYPMDKSAKIYVAGHNGLVGQALMRVLKKRGFTNLLTASHKELDLRDQAATRAFFGRHKPDYVFLTAAKVGGIVANMMYPAEFIYDNLLIASNMMDAAYHNGAKKVLSLGSGCIYPKFAQLPIKEDALLTGEMEPTNKPYAIAKIAGILMSESYRQQYGFDAISAFPVNLYGPYDNFHPENSHVIPGMMRRFHEAKIKNAPEVTIWGTGKPMREFMHVDDLADACLFLMENYSDSQHVNVGSNEEYSTLELAKMIAETVGYKGEIKTDTSRPDGVQRKLLDSSKLFTLGWQPKIKLRDGLAETYKWYSDNLANARR